MYPLMASVARITMVALIGATFSLSATDNQANVDNDLDNQTIIEEAAPDKNDAVVTYVKDNTTDQTPGDAAILFHIPGLTLTESAGPLGSSQIRYRGLSGGRFLVDLEGLSLNNPINGISDANAMFLFAAEHLSTNAQSLSITLPTLDRPRAKGVVGFGSQNTWKLGASAGTPLDPQSSIFSAMQASSTNGRFSYASPDLAKNDPTNNFYRENNDQHRLQALVKYARQTSTNGATALLALNAHEGGIAGYAFSPTPNLRSKAVYAGVKVGVSQKIKNAELSIDAANSIFDYRTSDMHATNEHLMASTHTLTLGFKRLNLPTWLDLDLMQQFIIERAYQLKKTRIGGGFLVKRTARFNGRLKPSVMASMSILGFSHHGIIRNKDLVISIEPTDFMSLTGRMKYSNRMPSFMEMYANNRFFMGNESLNDESIWDLELASNFHIGDYIRLQVNGFIGFIGDVIVYVPFLATKLRPTNTGSARRHGIDISFYYEPLTWLLLETKNSILSSKIKATNAPLPQAPLFSGLTKIRFGTEDFLALTIQSRYRGSTFANVYGTLRTKPYALFDGVLSARLFTYVGLSLSVSNIFNVKSARDTYEMPLPGTVIFGQIELGNV